MKFSRYNNFIELEDKFIGHNGISGKYFLFEQEIIEWINNAQQKKDLSEIEKLHPDLYYSLLEANYIVDENLDELQLCINKLKSLDNDDSKYDLHINPTMNCNFKCWYCYENHIKESKMNDETQTKVIALVNNIIASNQSLKTLQVNWFGGEPMLYFNTCIYPLLCKIQKITNENKIEFVTLFTSNGLLITEEVVNKLKEFNVKDIQITLDGHGKIHDRIRYISKKKGSYTEIVKNIKNVVRNNIGVHVRINCSDWSFEGMEKIIGDFIDLEISNRSFITFDFHAVWQNKEDLTDKMDYFINLFRKCGFNALSIRSSSKMRSVCYADRKNNSNINYNGDVYKCTARDFSQENKEGILNENGIIHWNKKQKIRLTAKYNNKPCFECSIFPICGGGCTQNAIESKGKDYCIYDFDESKKKKIIIDNFIATTI